MGYSLWRGSTQLGRIRLSFSENNDEEFHDSKKVHGMLELSVSDTDIQSIQQMRYVHGDSVFVMQHAIPDMNAAQPSNAQRTNAIETVGPRKLSPEEAMGVPPELTLTLRDAQGYDVPTETIMVTRMPDRFMQSRGWVARCAAAGVVMSPWSVGAFLT